MNHQTDYERGRADERKAVAEWHRAMSTISEMIADISGDEEGWGKSLHDMCADMIESAAHLEEE